MKKLTKLIIITGVAATGQLASAADITGTITLKGTPPKEKEITPVMEDANCSKLHTTLPTTHFYVVGGSGGRFLGGHQRQIHGGLGAAVRA